MLDWLIGNTVFFAIVFPIILRIWWVSEKLFAIHYVKHSNRHPIQETPAQESKLEQIMEPEEIETYSHMATGGNDG